MRWIGVAMVAVVLSGAPGPALAQDLDDNDFNIDAVTGPVLAGSRILGMGGAYEALASGIDGLAWNPASVASRTIWEVDPFQWEIAFSWLSPGLFSRQDYFNNDLGRGTGVDDFLFLTAGLRFQYGEAGGGVLASGQSFTLSVGGRDVDAVFANIRIGLGYGFLDSQLVTGIGLQIAVLNLVDAMSDTDLVTFGGGGLEVGGLLRLEGYPFRVGLTLRTPVIAVNPRECVQDAMDPECPVVEDALGVRRVDGLAIPYSPDGDRGVSVPWQVHVGFAWQFGDRPLNSRWEQPPDPETVLGAEVMEARCEREEAQIQREAEAAGQPPPTGSRCPYLDQEAQDPAFRRAEWARRTAEDQKMHESVDAMHEEIERAHERLSRHYYLLSAELLLIGATSRGIGIDAFLDQQRRMAGEQVSVGVRVGAETEPWQNRLKLRLGSYLEPARNAGVHYRIHGTFGFDLRLFRIEFLKANIMLTGVTDVSPRYYDFGIGIGFWH